MVTWKSKIFLRISPRKRKNFRKYFGMMIWGLGTMDLWEKNQSSKISCYCPFKGIRKSCNPKNLVSSTCFLKNLQTKANKNVLLWWVRRSRSPEEEEEEAASVTRRNLQLTSLAEDSSTRPIFRFQVFFSFYTCPSISWFTFSSLIIILLLEGLYGWSLQIFLGKNVSNNFVNVKWT